MLRDLLRWLPSLRDLDLEQQRAVNQPLVKGGNLIYGPAGSGKTAITLHRAATLANNKKDFILFVFTNALLRFIQAGARDLKLPTSRICSFYKWVWYQHGAVLGKGRYPEGNDKFVVMVDNLIKRWTTSPSSMPRYEYVLVDEAQDFEPNVARLLHMLTPNLLITADPAQSLYVETNGLHELQERWKPLNDPVIVKHNYRNPRPIAELASQFVDTRTTSPEAFLATVKGTLSGAKPTWYEVSSEQDMALTVASILKRVRGDKRVGVLCRSRKRPYRLKKVLNDLGVETQIALRDSEDDYDFNSPLPVLTTIHSAKGLEFDWVVLPDLDHEEWPGQQDEPSERRLFFVGVTRAKEKLFLISLAGRACCYLQEIQKNSPHLLQKPAIDVRGYSSTATILSEEDSPF